MWLGLQSSCQEHGDLKVALPALGVTERFLWAWHEVWTELLQAGAGSEPCPLHRRVS